jgi:hypothetical protein
MSVIKLVNQMLEFLQRVLPVRCKYRSAENRYEYHQSNQQRF